MRAGRGYGVLIGFAVVLLLFSCKSQGGHETVAVQVEFSADSAYRYVAEQTAFGARVPGSGAHRDCALYLRRQLERFGAEVEVQQGEMPDYKGDMQPIVNIIGHYGVGNPGKKVLLAAHWDSRPWADQEEDYEDRQRAVLGANDGASGVGVLLEIARQLGKRDSVRGVDIVFFDCEDMGTPDFYTGQEREDTWCLGSQLWSNRNRHRREEYQYGIVLDMVGAPDAVFPKEYFSMEYGQQYVEKLWRTARKEGLTQYFRDELAYPITDDHYYVNTIAGIPCVDIIHYDTRSQTGFAHWWHTQYDDMRNISPATLDAVGRVVLMTIGK